MSDKIYEYWFTKFKNPLKWLYAGNKYDDEIINNFKSYHDKLISIQKLDKGSDKFCKEILIYIICLDQFSRHIYRNSKKCYSYDNLTRIVVLENLNLVKNYNFIESIFFLMPLNHSENIDDKSLLIKIYLDMINRFPEKEDKILKFIKIINRRKNILKEYGRYPSRNKILGRKNSDKEKIFLKV